MADDFIKAVARGEVAGFCVDPDNPMLAFSSADIYSKPGTEVRFMDCNGTDADLEFARKFLVKDQVYVLFHTDIGNWHTDFYLVGLPGLGFNSVHFAEVT